MSERRNAVLSVGFVLITVALVVVSGGNVGAALAPIVGIVALVAFVSLPLRHTALFFFFVTLIFHRSGDHAHEGHWRGPLSLLDRILFINLRNLTGIGALKFNLMEAGLFLMLIVIAIRTLMGNNIDRHRDMPAARPLKIAVFASLAALAFAVVWGMVRGGGNFAEVLWQIRARFWAPILLIICMRAFKTEQDMRRLAVVLTVVCVSHVVEGAYFYHVIARPRGLVLKYAITHADTSWFVTMMVMLISNFIEKLSRRSLVQLVTLGGTTMYGIVINDRRIAYVGLILSVATMMALARHEIRRWLIRIVLVTLPLLIAYIVIGMHSKAAIFAPVQNLVSVSDNTDVSNWARNCENYDLIETLRSNPVLGIGWGQEYFQIKTQMDFPDFSVLHHPHNSMLGLLAFTGALGFFLIWIYMPIGVFLARRVYINASNSLQRITASMGICSVIIFMIQAYGDMGAKDTKATLILCASLACCANLAERIGALSERQNNSS